MRRSAAKATLAISALVLAATLIAWQTARTEPRADLVGAAVTAPPTTTTAPPVLAGDATSAGAVIAGSGPATFDARPPGAPRRLAIPTLGVDVSIVDVGLADDGSMQIPGASEAGWFEPGPVPGSSFGSAVIAAHIDFAGERGAFFDLPSLQTGEAVAVTDEHGDTREYVVMERFQVDKEQLPTEELFRAAGPHTLTLVTCGGAFDQRDRHYQDNIVVRAVPVDRAEKK